MAIRKEHTEEFKFEQTNNLIQLDEYFESIFLFINLELFRHYNKIV